MRRRYVSDERGRWVEHAPRKVAERKGPMIWNDIEDYRPIAGPEAEKFLKGDREARYISGRKQHREYLRRNRLEEVGNDMKPFLKNGGKTDYNPTKDWLKYGANKQWSRPDLERLMRGR